MSDVGKLCYKSGGNALCYKAGGNALVYKGAAGEETTIAFAWDADGKDLDICAYWVGDSANKAGWNQGFSGCTAPYSMTWSGDKTSTGEAERVVVKCSPWSTVSDANRVVRIHFNFYGYNASSYPGSTCTVIASQLNGPTFIKRSQPCSIDHPGPGTQGMANTNDPYCEVSFDASGVLLGIA